MCVNNSPKVATQWNSGATRDSNRGGRVLIPSALTTTPPSHAMTNNGRSAGTATARLSIDLSFTTPNSKRWRHDKDHFFHGDLGFKCLKNDTC